MKVLILGGSGMLGHKLWQVCAERFDAYVTFRQSAEAYAKIGLFDLARVVGNVSVDDFDSVARAVAKVEPEVVVNCIGIVKQDAGAKNPISSISINALFPHRLGQVCKAAGARLVHLSTDCVFSGSKGNYAETDVTDAEDLYGRTKLLGELTDEGCLTLRTSMIGRELRGAHGLLEWFLNQEGKTVRGFKRAIFSGFTTQALAEIIARIIAAHGHLAGVWHVAADPITKFDLLSQVKEAHDLNINIEPDESFVCDRSLNAERFRQVTGLIPPTWSDMITALGQDPTPYEGIRRIHC
jgi:dTDP-4-dehydrorhamnose reductase